MKDIKCEECKVKLGEYNANHPLNKPKYPCKLVCGSCMEKNINSVFTNLL